MLVSVTVRANVEDDLETAHIGAIVENELRAWDVVAVSVSVEEPKFRVSGVDIKSGESFDEEVYAADEAEAVQQVCSGRRIPARVEASQGLSVESSVNPLQGDS